MLRLLSLGSGSCGNCYCLLSDKSGILIDAGVGIRHFKKYLKEYDIPISHLKALLITHEHADHIKSAGYIGNDLQIPVYATPAIHRGMACNHRFPTKLREEIQVNLHYGQPVEVNDFRITPFPVPHDSVGNTGYQIQYGQTTLCLITDAGIVTPEMNEQIARANYLIIEANYDESMLRIGSYPPYLKSRIASCIGHLCNTETAQAIVQHMSPRLKHIWLCHLSEENNHPELARKTIESALQAQGYQVGTDILLDTLKRKIPTLYYLDEIQP